MVVVKKGKILAQTSANAYATLLIAHVGDVRDVLVKIVNNHATSDIHWKVNAWRVPSVSEIDAGKSRHPTTIPASADVVVAEAAVGTTGSIAEYQVPNNKSYTHVGIQFKSVVADTHSDDVDGSVWGREEHV